MEKPHGSRGVGKKVESHNATPLSELGITKDQSHRWQTQAAVPEPEREKYIAEKREKQKEITSAELLKMGQRKKRHEKRAATVVTPAKVQGDFELRCGDAVEELLSLAG